MKIVAYNPSNGGKIMGTVNPVFISFSVTTDEGLSNYVIKPGCSEYPYESLPYVHGHDIRLIDATNFSSKGIKTTEDAIFCVKSHSDSSKLIEFCAKETRATVLQAKSARLSVLAAEEKEAIDE